MKKLMLFVVALMSVICIFAISAGAATTNEFGTLETLDGIDLTGMANDTESRVVLYDGTEYHTYPSSYIVKDSATLSFDFSKLNAATSKKYDIKKVIRLEIPKGVTTIPENCFNNHASIIEVVLGNDVTTIAKRSFGWCKKLTTVTIGDNVTTLATEVFNGTTTITDVYVSSIDKWLTIYFDNSNGSNPLQHPGVKLFANGVLVEHVTVNTAEVMKHAFYGYDYLKSVTISSQLSSIKFNNNCFAGCDNLETVTIPSVDFWLTSVTLTGADASPFYSGPDAIYADGALLTSLTITPSTVWKSNIFAGAKSITSVTIEEGVTSLPAGAFYGLGITSVTFPSTLKAVPKQAFLNCKSLVITELPTTITSVGDNAFEGCTSITEFTMPSHMHINSFGTGVFKNTGLVNVVLPANFTQIKNYTFQNCASLKTVELHSGITQIGYSSFSGCTSLETVWYTGGIKQEYAVFLPESITKLYQEAFCDCDSIKYVSLPSTITYLGPSVFRSCQNLQFVDFNDNANEINLDNWGHFADCPSLKAASLPDGIKTINNRFMYNCTSLKAVYLPANLEQMNTNGNGQGPFCGDTNLYFVQEAFEVRGEDGYFLGDAFVMPAKPDVYYMPENLSRAGGNASSGTWFRDCASLNTTIVMPVNFTSSTVVQMFRETASASNIKNIVYLGDMVDYAWSERNHHINFIFANPADTDISSINFTSFYNNYNGDCYFYFCSTGYRYTMGKASAAEVATTKVENTYRHLCDIRNSDVVPATCITDAYGMLECFCGFEMGQQTLTGTATGIHIYADDHNCTTSDKCTADANCTAVTVVLSHEIYETLVYESFLANGEYCYGCSNVGCMVIDKEDTTKPIFVAGDGFSTKISANDGISGGYIVNVDALNEFNRVNAENKLNFGVMMVSPKYLAGKESFFLDGKINAEKCLQVDMSESRYTNLNITITGFVGDAKSSALIIALYAYVNGEEVEFIQSQTTQCADEKVTLGNDTLYTVTYESVANPAGKNLSDLGDYFSPKKDEE